MKKAFLLASVLIYVSCQTEPKGKDLFYGKWQGAKWVVNGYIMDGMDPSMIKFEFNKKDNTYSANFGSMSETGTFNLDNDCFNAMSIYNSPKKCPILRYGRDTMVWMMDSVQQPGHLYLVRVKE